MREMLNKEELSARMSPAGVFSVSKSVSSSCSDHSEGKSRANGWIGGAVSLRPGKACVLCFPLRQALVGPFPALMGTGSAARPSPRQGVWADTA